MVLVVVFSFIMCADTMGNSICDSPFIYFSLRCFQKKGSWNTYRHEPSYPTYWAYNLVTLRYLVGFYFKSKSSLFGSNSSHQYLYFYRIDITQKRKGATTIKKQLSSFNKTFGARLTFFYSRLCY